MANLSADRKGFAWTKGDASNPALALVVDGTSRALHICEPADVGTDWNVSADTNPSVYIHSATNPATEYIKMYHDATDAYIDGVGATALKLAIAGTAEVSINATDTSPTTSDGNALGTTSLMWSDLFLASGGVINFNAGDVTITHSSNALAFAGVTSASHGYSFDIAAGTIASESHGIHVTATGTLASGKSLVGLNVAATAAGTAGAWFSGLFVNATQAAKYVNGYLCAAEFELTSTAANASDNAVVVLNSVRNHTGSPPACDPYILLREYGTTYANTFFRVFGDTGQGNTSTFSATSLITSAQDTYEAGCNVAIRCMSGSTVFWLLGSTTAPTA